VGSFTEEGDVGSEATCRAPLAAKWQRFSFVSCLGTYVHPFVPDYTAGQNTKARAHHPGFGVLGKGWD